MSEFVASLNGDCGPTATLAALNMLDPVRWPLTPAGLKALNTYEAAHGWEESNGAQNIDALAAFLSHVMVHPIEVGYSAFTWDSFHSDLKANAGYNPVIVEWSLAGNLPGDEPGVHFHFSTCGGIDTGRAGDGVGGGYFWCDGDNSADDPNGAPRPPILYTIQQIQAAAPIAYVIVPVPPKVPPVDYEVLYKTLKADAEALLASH